MKSPLQVDFKYRTNETPAPEQPKLVIPYFNPPNVTGGLLSERDPLVVGYHNNPRFNRGGISIRTKFAAAHSSTEPIADLVNASEALSRRVLNMRNAQTVAEIIKKWALYSEPTTGDAVRIPILDFHSRSGFLATALAAVGFKTVSVSSPRTPDAPFIDTAHIRSLYETPIRTRLPDGNGTHAFAPLFRHLFSHTIPCLIDAWDSSAWNLLSPQSQAAIAHARDNGGDTRVPFRPLSDEGLQSLLDALNFVVLVSNPVVMEIPRFQMIAANTQCSLYSQSFSTTEEAARIYSTSVVREETLRLTTYIQYLLKLGGWTTDDDGGPAIPGRGYTTENSELERHIAVACHLRGAMCSALLQMTELVQTPGLLVQKGVMADLIRSSVPIHEQPAQKVPRVLFQSEGGLDGMLVPLPSDVKVVVINPDWGGTALRDILAAINTRTLAMQTKVDTMFVWWEPNTVSPFYPEEVLTRIQTKWDHENPDASPDSADRPISTEHARARDGTAFFYKKCNYGRLPAKRQRARKVGGGDAEMEEVLDLASIRNSLLLGKTRVPSHLQDPWIHNQHGGGDSGKKRTFELEYVERGPILFCFYYVGGRSAKSASLKEFMKRMRYYSGADQSQTELIFKQNPDRWIPSTNPVTAVITATTAAAAAATAASSISGAFEDATNAKDISNSLVDAQQIVSIGDPSQSKTHCTFAVRLKAASLAEWKDLRLRDTLEIPYEYGQKIQAPKDTRMMSVILRGQYQTEVSFLLCCLTLVRARYPPDSGFVVRHISYPWRTPENEMFVVSDLIKVFGRLCAWSANRRESELRQRKEGGGGGALNLHKKYTVWRDCMDRSALSYVWTRIVKQISSTLVVLLESTAGSRGATEGKNADRLLRYDRLLNQLDLLGGIADARQPSPFQTLDSITNGHEARRERALEKVSLTSLPKDPFEAATVLVKMMKETEAVYDDDGSRRGSRHRDIGAAITEGRAAKPFQNDRDYSSLFFGEDGEEEGAEREMSPSELLLQQDYCRLQIKRKARGLPLRTVNWLCDKVAQPREGLRATQVHSCVSYRNAATVASYLQHLSSMLNDNSPVKPLRIYDVNPPLPLSCLGFGVERTTAVFAASRSIPPLFAEAKISSVTADRLFDSPEILNTVSSDRLIAFYWNTEWGRRIPPSKQPPRAAASDAKEEEQLPRSWMPRLEKHLKTINSQLKSVRRSTPDLQFLSVVIVPRRRSDVFVEDDASGKEFDLYDPSDDNFIERPTVAAGAVVPTPSDMSVYARVLSDGLLSDNIRLISVGLSHTVAALVLVCGRELSDEVVRRKLDVFTKERRLRHDPSRGESEVKSSERVASVQIQRESEKQSNIRRSQQRAPPSAAAAAADTKSKQLKPKRDVFDGD